MPTGDPLTPDSSPQWSQLTVDDHLVRVFSAGPGQANEAVIFIHGNPGSAADFKGLVEMVADHHRGVAIELPDFGRSVAAPGFDHTVAGYADFLGDAIDALGIERAIFVLHDLGGPIGLRWIAGNLNRVAAVCLINTGVLPEYRWHRMARIWQTPVLGELAQAVTIGPAFRRQIMSAEPRSLPREFVDEMYSNFDRRTRRAVLGIYRDLKAIGNQGEDSLRAMADADLPGLVIWGAGDPYLPSSFAAKQKLILPSAEIHILPDSGHWPFIDDPPAVARLLADLLGRTG